MFFKQFYDTPLAQASYMVGCQATGEAIVIDPWRDVAPYVRTAAQEGLRIVNVTNLTGGYNAWIENGQPVEHE